MTNTNGSNEPILARVDAAFDGMQYYSFFFTSTRMIRALTISMAKTFAMGKGQNTSWCESMSIDRANQLAVMTPDAILQADKSNYDVPYTDLKSIVMKKGTKLGTIAEIMLGPSCNNNYITFMVYDKKFKYYFPRQMFDECADALRKLIPDKITIE